uniref:Transposase n=1 Tax=Acrobeloides nanus TaxID=290746 RepID=A0A914EJI1_9BILA
MHERGVSKHKITELLDIPRTTVIDDIRRYEETGKRLSKKLGINPVSAWQILREDLGLKPYKFQKRQKLAAKVKMKGKERAGAILKRLSRGRHRKTLFTDEKLFDIQQVGLQPPERQIYSRGPPNKEQRVVERVQKAESMMVWAEVCATGKTPLVFVEPGVKINRYIYMDMLDESCFPWTEQHFENDW